MMDLRKIEGLYRASWQSQSLDEWSSALKSICGNFNPVQKPSASKVVGLVEGIQAGGIDFAHVAYDLTRVDRGWLDIRRDHNEYLFLIVQLSGSAVIEQNDRQTRLVPGDCILIDSARPVSFFANSGLSNQLSVHLPRQLMISRSPVRLTIAAKLDGADPMATTIYSLIAKIMTLEAAGRRKAHMHSLFFDAVRFAFEFDDGNDLLPRLDGSYERCEIIEDVIDRRLIDPMLSPAAIAASLGQPLRRVQEVFHATGRTLTRVIREKRLKLAAQELSQAFETGARINIAQLAFACGFNDVSYFNRTFRNYYGITPSEAARDEYWAKSC